MTTPTQAQEREATQWRKKPVVITASQWFRHGDHPCVLDKPLDPIGGFQVGRHGWIQTLEGGHVVSPGDWIITGVQGEHYPCKPDIFAATYEPAHSPAPASGEAVTLSEEEIGASEYRGNTVSFMYQKAKAYGDTVLRMWKTLADAGFNNDPSGDNHVEDMLRAALAKANPAAGAEPKCEICKERPVAHGRWCYRCLGVAPPATSERDAEDARRYRFLRERLLAADFDWQDSGESVVVFTWPDSPVSADCDATVDAAIDAARNKEHGT